jgi:hypothetical protein
VIAKRINDPKCAGPSSWRPFFGVWGIKGLPITFTAAGKEAKVTEPV